VRVCVRVCVCDCTRLSVQLVSSEKDGFSGRNFLWASATLVPCIHTCPPESSAHVKCTYAAADIYIVSYIHAVRCLRVACAAAVATHTRTHTRIHTYIHITYYISSEIVFQCLPYIIYIYIIFCKCYFSPPPPPSRQLLLYRHKNNNNNITRTLRMHTPRTSRRI